VCLFVEVNRFNILNAQATLDHNMVVAARFSVPFRPHLFRKPQPSMLHLTKTALEEDEVFLIMVFIFSEIKRQDKTVCDVHARFLFSR
jgi:hypothetical protein